MRKNRFIAVLAAAVFSALPSLIFADEGPTVIANKEQHPYLTLDPFSGSISLTGLYQQQNSSVGGQSEKATDMLITEELSLATSGTIVSKNLAAWSAAGSLSLAQEWTTVGPESEAQTGIFDTFNVHLDLLSATEFPITAYAERTENLVNRAFAALLRDTNTTYGAAVHYNNPHLPSTLSFSHNTDTQMTLGGQEQFTIDQDEIDFSTSFQPFDRQSVSANLHYSTISQSNGGGGAISNNSELEGMSLSHNWGLDAAGRYTLTSTFDYSQQTGNFPFTQLRLGEQLRMRHSDTLESTLNYTLEQHDYGNTSTSRNSVSYNITHRLFESLVSTGRVGGSLSDNSFLTSGQGSTASTTNLFADVAFSYQKKIYQGRFGANLSLGYSQTENGAVGAPQQVLGDVETFVDPQPIILTRPGINAGTVVVFNAAGTQQLVPGIDYTVQTVGHTVHIERIVGGTLAANDSIRLNYLINPLPGYTSTSTSFGTGVSYMFEEGLLKGLYLYTHYSHVAQTITPADSNIEPDQISDTVVGAEYRVWKLTFRAEDEMRQSTLAPYNALRFTARYDHHLDERTSLSLDFTQNFIEFPSEQSRVALTTIDGRLQYLITPGLNGILTVRWRNDEDSRTGTTRGEEEQLELRWKIRQTDLYGMVRHTSLESNDSNASTFFFQLGITRNF